MQKSATLALALVWACGSALAGPSATPQLSTATVKVAMVFDAGGKEDKGFNQAASRGLERATAELGVQGWVDDTAGGKRADALRKVVAQKPALVVAVGFLFSDDVIRIAKENPQQKFAIVDFVGATGKETLPDNVLGLSFRDEEGAYLVGVLAALHSKSDKIGFIGGMDAPLMRRFAKGFGEGAKAVKPTIVTETVYADTTAAGFTNPGKGKALALAMYDKGVDVIFHASGATGLGIVDAAKAKKQWVIGVDRNNWKDVPGLMPATMVKHIDQAVFDACKSVKDGAWKGGVRAMSVKNGGVGIEWNDVEPTLAGPELRRLVKATSDDIASGKLRIE